MNKHNFDWQWYLEHNPDLVQAGITTADRAYHHWLQYGYRERRPCRKKAPGKLNQGNYLSRNSRQHIIMIHVFSTQHLPDILSHIYRLLSKYPQHHFYLLVNISHHPDPQIRRQQKSRCQQYLEQYRLQADIIETANKGGDIGGFLSMIKHIYLHQADIAKKSDFWFFFHTKTNHKWRYDLCRAITRFPLESLYDKQHKYGLIGSRKWLHRFGPNINLTYYKQFINNLRLLNKYYHLNITNDWMFIAGTMFIINRQIIDYIYRHQIDEVYQLLNTFDSVDDNWVSVVEERGLDRKGHGNDLSYRYHEGQPLLPDCMIEHTIERIIGLISQKLNLVVLGN